jgi:hypothetical protein
VCAIAAQGVDICACVDQFREDPQVPADPGPVERGVAVVVRGADDGRGVLDEPVDGVIVTASGGVHDVADKVLRVTMLADQKE